MGDALGRNVREHFIPKPLKTALDAQQISEMKDIFSNFKPPIKRWQKAFGPEMRVTHTTKSITDPLVFDLNNATGNDYKEERGYIHFISPFWILFQCENSQSVGMIIQSHKSKISCNIL